MEHSHKFILNSPIPYNNERPTNFADRVGIFYTSQISNQQRKEHGLYLTPITVADFMAQNIRLTDLEKVRILDPAAGCGILSCAAVESIISKYCKINTIELVVYEIDKRLGDFLRLVLEHLANWCESEHKVNILFRLELTDFVLANNRSLQLQAGLLQKPTKNQLFDLIISNPPYFKIRKSDPRSIAMGDVIKGQPNIYSLFMATSATLLNEHGIFIFITPRSFASGLYFRKFRKFFFNLIRPTAVHVFASRRDAFSRDAVLQENIILWGERIECWSNLENDARIKISSSCGVRDIEDRSMLKISIRLSLDLDSHHKILRLSLNKEEEEILELVDSWKFSLHSLGLEISTGRVVPFRATSLVDSDGKVPSSHFPLLWMNHVEAMRTTWPLKQHKPEYIKREGAETLLLPNRNYVLIRRFSSKEQLRRLTAAPFIADSFDTPHIGFENHLNYIHRPGSELSNDEAIGLAALYSSRLLDVYFRTINGNTQVNATELRSIPLPPIELIVALGQLVKRFSSSAPEIDQHLQFLLNQAS